MVGFAPCLAFVVCSHFFSRCGLGLLVIQGEDLTTSDAPAIGANVDSEHLLVDACQFPPVSVAANMGGSCFDPYTSPATLDADIDDELLAHTVHSSSLPGASASGHEGAIDCGAASPSQRASVQVPFHAVGRTTPTASVSLPRASAQGAGF